MPLMNYKLVAAADREEALRKSGLEVGTLARIAAVRVCYAGEGCYAILPVLEGSDAEEGIPKERFTDVGRD